ncbi:MAG: methyltransferase domain-containing protein [Gammaproteobacteria bacterium]|nr:methyltransferase domain-containing protein [Gammaproteobacteria bacterium]
MLNSGELAAKIEPFDSFWEGPENVEKGYHSFFLFYKNNYLNYLPSDKDARILNISCGPGYFVNLLSQCGYTNVLGIDSDAEKIKWAQQKSLNCKRERAFEYLQESKNKYDVIFCEQEINHLTKTEIPIFLRLCKQNLKEGGTLIIHALNGANPITGAEALAQNFDHYNTCTEYTMRQMLEASDFQDVKVFPLNLYVFYKNPLNYLLIAISALYTFFFRFSFLLYGKSNKIFTKKIGAVCKNP